MRGHTSSVTAELQRITQLVLHLNTTVTNIHERLEQIMAAIDDLTAAVANDTTVDQSAITLLNGLKQQLDAAIASGNPAQLQALSDQLGTNAAGLAAAVTANTPVGTPPAP